MRFPLPAIAVLGLVACAGEKPVTKNASGKSKEQLASNAGGPAAKGKYVCTFEEDLGSHFRQKVCRYIDDHDDARGRQQDDLREMGMHDVRNPTMSGNSPGSGVGGH